MNVKTAGLVGWWPHRVHMGERQDAALGEKARLFGKDVEVESDAFPGDEGVAVCDLG